MLIDYNNFYYFMDTKSMSLSKSVRLKNCQGTSFRLIIGRVKLMELLIPYHNIVSRVLRKKRPSKPKIQISCIDYNLH